MSAVLFPSLAQVKQIIAIASGKGGVGKSTVTVNLAHALNDLGQSVAVLDADIYGPSLPAMLGGADARPEVNPDKTVQPVVLHNIKAMSIGFLLPAAKSPTIWRGPMVSGALQQLIRDTQWGSVDYLLIDLPPGTGDIQLTLAQKVPLTGAIVVSTPQNIALLDARKAIEMFHKVNIPILGVVENMSTYICPKCGHQEAIFGDIGGAALTQEYETSLLGQIPLTKQIRTFADQGKVLAQQAAEGAAVLAFKRVAEQLIKQQHLQTAQNSRNFPNIDI